ncbi:MAG: hypothetical protein H6817_09935 [Phycisphaerales bacterium]|nr:hypothetical protein [Phycisphaerales bacterium]
MNRMVGARGRDFVLRPLPYSRGSDSAFLRRHLSVLLIAFAFAASDVRADEPVITNFQGVTIVRGHLDQTIVPDNVGVEVLEPVHATRGGRSVAFVEWANVYRRALDGATVKPRPRVHQPTPPWKYTPSDHKYTPKTDWTYHPKRYRHWL